MERTQLVRISPRATAFTVVCPSCAEESGDGGRRGASFAGRLDLDLDGGVFLCRRGHSVRVERERPAAGGAASEAA